MKKLSILLIALFGLSCSNEDSPQQEVCTNPEISISSISLTTATINFNNFIAGNSYELEYGEARFILGSGTMAIVTEENFTISGLDNFKSYDVFARLLCSSSQSEWVGPFNFVTQCDVDNGIFEGNVTLTNQQEVNDFGAMCYSGINGILRIGTALNNNINSLLPLTNINSVIAPVGNYSVIIAGTQLESLEGINIVNATLSLQIEGNNVLTSFEGINLNNTIDQLLITNNDALFDLSGLEDLTSITSYFSIQNNNSLESLQGLNNLESWRFSYFTGNTELQNFEGLDNLETIVDIFLIDTNIKNFIGLESLTTISSLPVGGISSVEIYDNDMLESFDGLENALVVAGNVKFYIGIEANGGSGGGPRPNSMLSDFCGIQNLVNNSSGNVELFIANNLYNPTAQDIIDGNCSQ